MSGLLTRHEGFIFNDIPAPEPPSEAVDDPPKRCVSGVREPVLKASSASDREQLKREAPVEHLITRDLSKDLSKGRAWERLDTLPKELERDELTNEKGSPEELSELFLWGALASLLELVEGARNPAFTFKRYQRLRAERAVLLFLEGHQERELLKIKGRVEIDEEPMKFPAEHHADILGANSGLPAATRDGEQRRGSVTRRFTKCRHSSSCSSSRSPG